ncbi:MAG TPA: lysophospholipid acyltransferase family protein [Cryptosporangiaceae bacterium]|nr:lysophospholipid acyltransferase family protein [Cryptosporangiaceae bacterium]
MPEARIIPFDGDKDRSKAGTRSKTTSGTKTTARKKATKAGANQATKPGAKNAKPGAKKGERTVDRAAAVPVESAGDAALVSPASATRPPPELRDLGQFRHEAGGDPVDPAATTPDTGDGNLARAADPPAAAPDTGSGTAPEDPWDRKVAGALSFLRRRLTGEYEVDEFGFDAELTDTVLAAPFRPLYEKWFRVEVSGMEHVPDTGGALIVANHSGTIALDGVMTALALLDHHPARRHLRLLGADLVFKTPFVGEFARKSGNTLACQADAERLLSKGELVGVYPEGFKGVGKPFADRYKLQRFGRGGFVSAALATKAPIIPCAIVGAEEIYPMLGNSPLLARLLGAPYFPLTPTFPWLGLLGLIPLPSKWYIEFGPPIETADLAGYTDDQMLMFNLTDQVRETIQQSLYRLLMKRSSVFG